MNIVSKLILSCYLHFFSVSDVLVGFRARSSQSAGEAPYAEYVLLLLKPFHHRGKDTRLSHVFFVPCLPILPRTPVFQSPLFPKY